MLESVRGTPTHLRDSKRRWLRHTYQEGPGFRFLATRGGRPPELRARPAPLSVVRRRARALRLWREEGLAAALAVARTSRASLFRWQAAYAAGGLAALLPEPRGPRAAALGYPVWIETVVIAVRLATYWNAKRIAAELRRREIATVSHRWIERLFERSGSARSSLPVERGPRYERGRPNELWHIDIKGPFFIQLVGGRRLKTWIVGLVDDHSRYVLGLRIHTDTQIAPILGWLRERIDLCGVPLALMSDNDARFVYWIPGVLTRFGKTLEELRIRHIRTQVNSPWTNGKVERLWGTLQAEVLDRQIFRSLAEAEAGLADYTRYYNYHRLHGEIGWCTPAERFDGTPFTDHGFENIPALAHLKTWLEELRAAA
jgi:transposase InsO family protein